ncbi:Type I 3-dehydroquinase domain containing protein [Hyaloscypha variabilis]
MPSHAQLAPLKSLPASLTAPAGLRATSSRAMAFGCDASIVFVGPRGNGKSSLAVIAGTILHRRVVDADDYFLQLTKLTRGAFRKAYGMEEYRARQLTVTRSLLSNHEEGCVLACGPSFLEGEGRMLFQKYGQRHPIIYVHRKVETIQSYLGIKERSSAEKYIQDIDHNCRQLCNFEYFNLSEDWTHSSSSSDLDSLEDALPNRSFYRKARRTLQNTKADLTGFLKTILNNSDQVPDGAFYTLFPTSPEARIYTNALAVPLSAVNSGLVNLGEIQDGIDAIELVLDQLANPSGFLGHPTTLTTICQSIAIIRRQFSVPIILHVELDLLLDHKQPQTLALYFDLLRLGLRFATDYLTVDLRGSDADILGIIQRKGHTKIIGHYFDTNPQSESWRSSIPMARYQRARSVGCDLVRLCQPALSAADNFSCYEFVAQVTRLPEHIPIIAYNVGSLGHLSVTFNRVLTPVSHQSMYHDSSMSTKDIISPHPAFSAKEIRQTMYACRALDKLNFYVLGTDVRLSISPAMHNAAFKACGMPHFYDIRQINSLREIEPLIKEPNFGGASISLPFKPEILWLVDSLSPSAKITGAINTLLPVRDLDGLEGPTDPRRAGPIKAFHGDNTDWIAVYACILRYVSPANAVGSQTTALIFGAGGMARAAIYALARLGVRRIFIFNRTLSNAEKLATYYNKITQFPSNTSDHSGSIEHEAKGFNLEVSVLESLQESWPQGCAYPSIVVNTVPLNKIGSTPPPDFEMPASWLQNPTGGVMLELSYQTLDNSILKQVREERNRGWIGVDPIKLFFEQGCAQFEIFTGCKAPRKVMWEACLRQHTGLVNHESAQRGL